MNTINVYSVDMWGHVPSDCHKHGCPCITTLEDGSHEHNDDDCSCHEDMNDRRRAGSFDLEGTDDDAAIIAALVEHGYLTEQAIGLAEIQDDGSEGPWRIVDKEGRCILMVDTNEAEET